MVTPTVITKMDIEAIAREPVSFFMNLDEERAEAIKKRFEKLAWTDVPESEKSRIKNLNNRIDELKEENRELESENQELKNKLSAK